MPVKKQEVITVPTLKTDEIQVHIVGATGLYVHRMSEKVKHTLLVGGGKKTAAEKVGVKHNPRQEFLDCMFVDEGWHPNSHIRFPSIAFKSAMGTAALVTPGMKKTDVSRMVYIADEWVPIFGLPMLRMGVMRSADMNRTPDVRTRPYFPTWGSQITIRFVKPYLTKTAILTLLNNAGIVAGVGDSRQEKGKGSSGAFQVANAIPKGLLDADAQWKAIQGPVAFDQESADLLEWVDGKIQEQAA